MVEGVQVVPLLFVQVRTATTPQTQITGPCLCSLHNRMPRVSTRVLYPVVFINPHLIPNADLAFPLNVSKYSPCQRQGGFKL